MQQQLVLIERDAIKELVSEAVKEAVSAELPALVRSATRKPYLTGAELMELTGWSKRTLVYLRQKRKIPFTQDGRKILYPTEGIENFLRQNHVTPRSK